MCETEVYNDGVEIILRRDVVERFEHSAIEMGYDSVEEYLEDFLSSIAEDECEEDFIREEEKDDIQNALEL